MTTENKSFSLPRPSLSPQVIDLRGSILMISLWALCLLTSFAVILGYGVRQKIALIQRLDERDRLRLIAAAGAERAIAELKNTDWAGQAASALQDKWSNNSEAFSEVPVGKGRFNVCYNYVDEPTGASQLWYGMVDEERKINLNKAGMPLLKNLLTLALNFDEMQAQELAASIVDWRDSDSELSIPAGSAEDSYYTGLSYPYEAKDAAFQVPEELLLVKGMTQGIFERLKNYVTVYGEGQVNINTASKIVLLSLGLSEYIADNILAYRSGEDKTPGTSDDNVFGLTADIVPRLGEFCNLSETDIELINAVIEQQPLTTKSGTFLIRSIAGLNNRQNTGLVLCIVDWKGKVLYWQES